MLINIFRFHQQLEIRLKTRKSSENGNHPPTHPTRHIPSNLPFRFGQSKRIIDLIFEGAASSHEIVDAAR